MTMSYVGLNPVGPVAPNNVSFGDALRRAGLNPVETTLGLPYMFLAPAGSDPDMQGVQVLIKGLQNTLNRAGYRLVPDGRLGPDTAAALNRLSPPRGSYAAKPWFQIYGDVLSQLAAGARVVSSRVVHVGALGGMGADDGSSDDPNINAIAAQTSITAAQAAIGAQTPVPGSYMYDPSTGPPPPSSGGSPTTVSSAAPSGPCNVWDFPCWARQAGARVQASGIPPVLLAGGVLAGLWLLTSKKGRRR